ncbi:MAG: outer membrane protein assembly factor BamB family protein, partial [Planctomycetota bacterium]
PTIINCNITGNTAAHGEGGGIFCWTFSSPTIINCNISGNSASWGGGGIHCRQDSSLTITNCTITANTTSEFGGGIYLNHSTLTITGSTISGNAAQSDGGGIYCGDNSSIFVTDSIVWGNTDSGGTDQSAQISGTATKIDVIYSCIQDANPDDANIPFGGDANSNIDDNPMFIRDPNDGWGTGNNDDFGDLHLQSSSPCIEAGLPNFIVGPNAVDMDAQPRIIGHRVDMGADEYAPMIVVTKPQGGEIWTAGSVHDIEWDSYGVNTVDILLSVDGGGSWKTVEGGVGDSGIYMWGVSASVDSDECVISVVPNPPDANVVTIGSGVFSVWAYHGPASLPRGWRRGPKVGERYGPEFGCVKWKFETDGPVTAAVTVGRKIEQTTKTYIACEDGRLYALDADTGAVVWSYDTNSALIGSAAEGRDGTVYIGSEGGKLYAIDKKGQLLWTHTTGGPVYSSPAISPNGRIYACSLDGVIYALARDGSELWSFETGGVGVTGGSILASLAIAADGTVYTAGLYDPNLYALNQEDGSVKWYCSFNDPCDPNSRNGWPFASPVVAPDANIYMSLLYDPNLYAINPNDGSIIWATNLADPCSGWFEPDCFYPPWPGPCILLYQLADSGWSEPALAPDGTIYVSFDDPYLRAVDPNGTIKWVTKLGEMGGFTLTVGGDGLIYAASDDKNVYVVNGEGAEIAQFEGDDWLSWPVIGADGTLYVSDANNAVWAISEEACDGETPVLDGRGGVESKRPVKFKGR